MTTASLMDSAKTMLSGAVDAIFGSGEATQETAALELAALEKEERAIDLRLERIPGERPDLISRNDRPGLHALELEVRGLRERKSVINDRKADLQRAQERAAREAAAREAQLAGARAHAELLARGAGLSADETKKFNRYSKDKIDAGREMEEGIERFARGYAKDVRSSAALKSLIGSRAPTVLLGTMLSKIELDTAIQRELYRVSSTSIIGADPYLVPGADPHSMSDRDPRKMRPISEVIGEAVEYLRRLILGGKAS